MSVSNGPSIITSGLVLSLDAADKNSYPGSGTTWRDLSGNGANGTLTNGPTFSSVNQGSIVFDGVDDYVTCGSTSVLDLRNAFTISIFVYLNALQDGGLYDRAAINSTNSQFLAHTRVDGTIAVRVVKTSSYDALPSVPYSANTWFNLTATYDGTVLRSYKNGSLVGTSNTVTAPISGNSSDNFFIGALGGTGIGYNLNGRVGLTMVYNRALSASEIAQNYSATKTRFGL